jgi:hypothetical protein
MITYLLATDIWRLARLRWVAETSMLKTLAAKHGSTVSKTAAKHKATVETPRAKDVLRGRIERTGRQPLEKVLKVRNLAVWPTQSGSDRVDLAAWSRPVLDRHQLEAGRRLPVETHDPTGYRIVKW